MRSAVPPSLPKGTHEIIKDRLYFTSFRKSSQRRLNQNFQYFTIDNTLKYQPFFADFGPLNLGQLYRFCCLVSDRLADAEQHDKAVVYYCRTHPQSFANAAYLIGAFQIICMSKTAAEAYAPFAKTSFVPFRDASMGHCSYAHTVQHCLEAIEKASHSKFLDFNTFNLGEYEHYERVECGDFNVIVPGKFLAFSGPSSGPVDADGYAALTPAHYVPIFSKIGVSTIVRLNRRCYDRRKFTAKGFTHYDLIYPDGTIPPPRILDMFLDICIAAEGIVAVHCKAGLGRTGTLIACYMMRYCGWNARECIAWIRICRPGSVIGPQQYYLLEKESELMALCRNDNLKKQLLPSASASTSVKGATSASSTPPKTMTTPPTPRRRRSRQSGRMSRDADGVWRRVSATPSTPKDKSPTTPTDLDFGDDPFYPPRIRTLTGSSPQLPPKIKDLSELLMNSRISTTDRSTSSSSTENVPRNYSRTVPRTRKSTPGSRNSSKIKSTRGTGSSTASKSSKDRDRMSLSGELDRDLLRQHRCSLDGSSSPSTTRSTKVESRLSSSCGLRPDQISQGRYLMNAKRGIREKLSSSTKTVTTPTSKQRSSHSHRTRHSSSSSRPVPIRSSSLTNATVSSSSSSKASSSTSTASHHKSRTHSFVSKFESGSASKIAKNASTSKKSSKHDVDVDMSIWSDIVGDFDSAKGVGSNVNENVAENSMSSSLSKVNEHGIPKRCSKELSR